AGRRVALFLIDGEPHALDDECPHQGASLGDGVIAGGDVTCPWHGWHFDPCSGKSTDGLDESVELFPARVDEEGWVEVALSLSPDA
ncbi:MAG: Rieske 2Fe-2S domain-containing protein, partial [Planctomycetota bacterium]